MRKFLSLLIVSVLSFAPLFVDAQNTYVPKKSQNYISGPKGGCYYWNKKGNKTYVDRKLCRKSGNTK